MSWQLQEAQQKFSELVRRALEDDPQLVTCHGEEVAVVVSAETFRRLNGSEQEFKAFLLSGPEIAELDIRRPSERTRPVDP